MAESSAGSDDDQDELDTEAEQELGTILASVAGVVNKQGDDVADGLASDNDDDDADDDANADPLLRAVTVVVTGKRPAGDLDQSHGESSRKRLRFESQSEDGSEYMEIDDGDEADHEDEAMDANGDNDADSDQSEELEAGRSRRKLYFERDNRSSDSSDYEEEPSAYLTHLRSKQEYNAAKANAVRQRRLKETTQTPEPSVASEGTVKKGRGKALAPINEPYLELLNETIHDARNRILYPEEEFQPSMVGQVSWAASEKQRFFRALPRLGRYNPVGLAQEVETKSAVEVQGYLNELKKETDKRMEAIAGSQHTLLMMEDIPAAVEVSAECEDILNKEAERIAAHVAKNEAKEAKEKWEDGGDSIDIFEAKKLDSNDSEDAGLLDTLNWLMLANRIFMTRQDRDISDVAAIHKQTLEDLTKLAKSVTRRLVHITLFQTRSRIKSCLGSKYRTPPSKVTIRDVGATLKLLGMPTSSEEYWRHVPRRFQLRVFRETGVGKGSMPVFLSYDQVEEEMKSFEEVGVDTSQPLAGSSDFGSTPGTTNALTESDNGWQSEEDEEELQNAPASDHSYHDDNEEIEESEAEAIADVANGDESVPERTPRGQSEMARYLETDIDLEGYLPAEPIRPLGTRQKKQMLDELHYINEDEEYLNAIDNFHSLREEKKLWKLLGGWKERKTSLHAAIEEADRTIPSEPQLSKFRRLERWKRQEWRSEAEEPVPVWQQHYFKRLLDGEKIRRIEKKNDDEKSTTTKAMSEDSEEHDDSDDVEYKLADGKS